MKKYKKRITAAALAAAVALVSVAGGTAAYGGGAEETVAAEPEVLYEENFDGRSIAELTSAGWQGLTDANFSVTGDGRLKADAAAVGVRPYYTGDGSAQWSDYTLEADITLEDIKDDTKVSFAQFAAYTDYSDARHVGIEFGPEARAGNDAQGSDIDSKEHFTTRLYGRAKEDSPQAGKCLIMPVESANDTAPASLSGSVAGLSANNPYRFKMKISGRTVTCYINDIPVLRENFREDYTAEEVSEGGIALYAQNCVCYFDNLLVTKNAAEETPAPPSGWFTEDFESADNDSLAGKGWQGQHETATRYAGGEYHVSGVDDSGTFVHWNGVPGVDAANMADYTVEADVIPSGIVNKGKNSGQVNIMGRYTDAGHYEFGLLWGKTGKASWRLLYRDNAAHVLQSAEQADFDVGKKYRLTLVMSGNKLSGYVTPEGGERITVFENFEDDSAAAGCPGFGMGNGPVTVDNFAVSQYSGVWFRDEFPQGEGLKSGWDNNSGPVALGAGGGAEIPVAGGRMRLTGLPGSDRWTDYTVTAEFTDCMPKAGVSSGLVGVVARGAADNTGYEFSVLFGNHGDGNNTPNETAGVYMRLAYRGSDGSQHYLTPDRNSQYDFREVWDGKIPQRTDKYRIKMKVSGAVIECYVGIVKEDGTCDEHLVYTADTEQIDDGQWVKLTGTAGIATTNAGATCTSFTVSSNEEEPDDGSLYREPFDVKDGGVLVPRGWDKEADAYDAGKGAKVTDTLYLNGEKKPEGAFDWTSYIYEGDVKFETAPSATGAGFGITGLTTGGGNGYGFGIFTDDGFRTAYAKLYKVGAAGPGDELERAYLPEGITLDEVYRLKIAFTATASNGVDRILCYIGDETDPVIDRYVINEADGTLEPLEFQKGSIGMQAVSAETWVDNLRVHTDFNSIVIPEVKDVEYKKPVLPEGVWFRDDFESPAALEERGWTGATGDPHNGVLETNSALFVTGDNKRIWTNPDGKTPEAWGDYQISARVSFDVNTMAEDKLSCAAAVAAHSDGGNNGFEFGMVYAKEKNTEKVYVRLWDRGYKKNDTDLVIGSQLAVNNSVGFDPGAENILRMAVKGDRVLCWINDTLVIDVTVDYTKTATPREGSFGVRAGNVRASFDNVVVEEVPEDLGLPEDGEFKPGEVWFSDDFEDDTFLSERGWLYDDTKIENGELLLTGSKSSPLSDWRNYLTGYPGALEWDNYVFEADVRVHDIANENPDISGGVVAIIARVTGVDTGYEFGLMSGETDAVNAYRLGHRKKGGWTELEYTTGASLKKGVTYRMKMIVLNDRIRCYVDNRLIFDYTDKENLFPKGSIAVMANKNTTSVDNIRVTGYSAAAELPSGQGGGSGGTGGNTGGDQVQSGGVYNNPQTGDERPVALAVTVFVCAVALAAVLVIARKRGGGRA